MDKLLNSYRVFPRLFAVYYMWGMSQVLDWFSGLPDPSTAQAGTVSAVVAAGAAYFKFYVDTGVKQSE